MRSSTCCWLRMAPICAQGLFLHDYAELLSEFAPRYRSVYLAARRAGWLQVARIGVSAPGWIETLRSSISTLRQPLSFQDHLDNFCPMKNRLFLVSPN